MVLQELLDRITFQFGGLVLLSHLLATGDKENSFSPKTKNNLMLSKLSVVSLGDQINQPNSSWGTMGFKFHILRVKVSLLVHRERTVTAVGIVWTFWDCQTIIWLLKNSSKVDFIGFSWRIHPTTTTIATSTKPHTPQALLSSALKWSKSKSSP